MRLLPTVVLASAFASLLAAGGPPPGDEEDDGARVGDMAPVFKLRRLGSDETVRLKDLRGKPTVLIFGSYT